MFGFCRLLFVILLFLSVCVESVEVLNGNSTGSVQQEYSQQIISYAREYRKNTTLSVENEALRQKTILEQVFTSLKKYDFHLSLDDAVSGFLADELDLNVDDYTVIDASLTEIGGKSHDRVFLVKDISGDLICVVKAFRNPRELSSKFVPEVSALDLIQQSQMPGVVPIKPMAVAAYSDEDGSWGLLMETAAKGQRVDQFIYQLGKLPLASKERAAFLEVFQRVFQRVAESLAALHSRKSSHPFSIPDVDVEKFDNKLSTIVESHFIVGELEKRLSAGELFHYLEDVKARALKSPVFYSYLHGDAHLGNMFYDLAEDAFYFIDVAKLHHSVGIDGEPLLNGIRDLMSVEGNLRRKAIGFLSENEIEALLTTLYNTYEQASGSKIDPNILLFERVYKNLGRLVDYAKYIEEEDPVKRSATQAVFESAIEFFVSLKLEPGVHAYE